MSNKLNRAGVEQKFEDTLMERKNTMGVSALLGDKKQKLEKENVKLSAILTSNLGSMEVAEQPRRV